MNLKTFLATVRLYWKTFVVVTVMVCALGLTWLLLTPMKYVSTTQLLVSIDGSMTAAAFQNAGVVEERVNSYIALLTSDVVSQRVIDKLGLSLSAPELAAKISAVNVPPKTSVIDVAVTDESPEQARRIADAVAGEFIRYTDALETPTGEDGQKVHTTMVSAASEPRSRRAERVVLGVLAGLVALVLAPVAVWIRSLTDRVVRTANRAAVGAGVPVLGSITSSAIASVGDLEGYRRLRPCLRSTASTGGGRVVEITSVCGEIDASAIATNFGVVMELAGSRSIVLDAASEEPAGKVHHDNGSRRHASPTYGLGELVRAADGHPDTLAGREWAEKPDRVAAKAASDLVEWLRGQYQYVFIAAPPVLLTPTASAASEYTDAVLLLVCPGNTKRRELALAAERLNATCAPLIGVLLVAEGAVRASSRRPGGTGSEHTQWIRRPGHDHVATDRPIVEQID